MSIHTNTSVPSMSGSPRRLGRNIVVAAAGSIVLAAAVGGGLWARSDRQEAASPAVSAVAAVGPAASGSLAVSHASASYTPHTVYIVGSQEQATLVWVGINDGNAVRNEFNLPPLLDEVLVAHSDGEAAAFVAGVNDSNRILAGLYQVENRIVDLRG